MTVAVSRGEAGWDAFASAALKAAVRFWFVVAVAGQLVFALYTAVFYGGSAARGDFEGWNKVLVRGYVAGDAMGNAALAAHLLLAVVITVGGPLQLIPQVRARVPRLHRLNGRVYVLTAFAMSVLGLYMILVRGGAAGDASQHAGTCLNAVLIIAFAAMAWRTAVARDLRSHRRWALRLFLAVSGVWFFRVGLMLWLALNGGPVGFDPETFRGPFLTFLAFAQYLLPLAVLEAYLRSDDRTASATTRIVVATSLFVLTVGMGIGILVAYMGMWRPHL